MTESLLFYAVHYVGHGTVQVGAVRGFLTSMQGFCETIFIELNHMGDRDPSVPRSMSVGDDVEFFSTKSPARVRYQCTATGWLRDVAVREVTS